MKTTILLMLALVLLPVQAADLDRELNDVIVEQTRLLDNRNANFVTVAEDGIFDSEYEEPEEAPAKLSDKILYLERKFKEERRKRIMLERAVRKLVNILRINTEVMKSTHEDKDRFYDLLKMIGAIIGAGATTGAGAYVQLHRKTNRIRDGHTQVRG